MMEHCMMEFACMMELRMHDGIMEMKVLFRSDLYGACGTM